MTPITDVPQSTLRVQLPGFSTLRSALTNHVSSLQVRSFAATVSTFKVKFMALGNNWTYATMFNTFAPDVLNSLQNKKMCTCTVHHSCICDLHDIQYTWTRLKRQGWKV